MSKATIVRDSASGGAVYGLGLIGAFIYYLTTASGFTEILAGILKAILWPTFMVYEVLQRLGI